MSEQFFLKKQFVPILKRKLKKYSYRDVVEIGIGTGLFTKVFIKNGIKVTAFEIDRSLKYKCFNKKNLKVIYKPFDFKYLKKDIVLISAPPYALLEEISKHNVKYILMAGERYLKYFNDYKIIAKLEGSSFSPKSRGQHFIITNLS